MNNDTEYVSLPKELAKKIEAVKDPASDEMMALINGYIDKTRKNYKDNLELLDEDVVLFRGLLVNVKRQYQEALNAQLVAEEELWEEIDKQRPRLSGKIQTLVVDLEPLAAKLKEIDGLLKSINTWEVGKLVEQVSFLSNALGGKTGEMIRFICTQYKPKGEKK